MRKPQRTTTPAPAPAATVYSFGDPESVLDSRLTDYLGVFVSDNGRYYQPPVSFAGLGKVLHANAHHGAIAYFKRNMLLRFFRPSALLDRETLKRIALDFVVFGNCFPQAFRDGLGNIRRLGHLPAINMRRAIDGRYLMLRQRHDPLLFAAGEVLHLMEYDVQQNIYGTPEYLGGLQSLLLNEDATLFRRRYYKNGAHTGFIFYTNDQTMQEDDEKNLREQIASSKGVGNFRSMFVRIPGGSEKSVQIIPVGDIATKDEFERIKNISRNDIISAWRMRPELAGIMPDVAGGTGDITKINQVYIDNEIRPLAEQVMGLNHFLPGEPIRFVFPDVAEGP